MYLDAGNASKKKRLHDILTPQGDKMMTTI
jgi:hypothetical protein